MNLLDIAILLLLVLSAILGFRSGLIQSVVSLAGLIAGIVIASQQYRRVADLGFVNQNWWFRQAVAFCVIVVVVMILAWLIGLLLKSLIAGLGLRWLDRVLGLVFGLLRGALLAGLCIALLVAFYSDADWVNGAHLPTHFSIVAEWVPAMSAGELKARIENGLEKLEKTSQQLLHTK